MKLLTLIIASAVITSGAFASGIQSTSPVLAPLPTPIMGPVGSQQNDTVAPNAAPNSYNGNSWNKGPVAPGSARSQFSGPAHHTRGNMPTDGAVSSGSAHMQKGNPTDGNIPSGHMHINRDKPTDGAVPPSGPGMAPAIPGMTAPGAEFPSHDASGIAGDKDSSDMRRDKAVDSRVPPSSSVGIIAPIGIQSLPVDAYSR